MGKDSFAPGMLAFPTSRAYGSTRIAKGGATRYKTH